MDSSQSLPVSTWSVLFWFYKNVNIVLLRDECVQLGCDYIFVVDTEARLTNADTLLTLIEANKPVVAPVLIRHKQFWSNFWGALTHDGFYSRSHDYLQIVQNERR